MSVRNGQIAGGRRMDDSINRVSMRRISGLKRNRQTARASVCVLPGMQIQYSNGSIIEIWERDECPDGECVSPGQCCQV